MTPIPFRLFLGTREAFPDCDMTDILAVLPALRRLVKAAGIAGHIERDGRVFARHAPVRGAKEMVRSSLASGEAWQ